MKIAVIGATGPTGKLVVEQALSRMYEVIALVRNPDKLANIKHENLKVVKADVFSSESLKEHLHGCNAVISSIGAGLGFSTVTLYSESVKALTAAMRDSGVKRLLCVSSWHTKSTEEPYFFTFFVRPLFLGRVLTDMDRMEMYLSENCSDLDYTVVRCPQLTNSQLIPDKKIQVSEDRMHVPGGSYVLPRSHVADFLLNTIQEDTYKQKLISIALDS